MADLLATARAASKPTTKPATKPQAAPTAEPEWDYTPADLEEMDRLLHQLADMERWHEDELDDKLDQRRRMAPVNVVPVLRQIKAAHKKALAGWPNVPAERSNIRLCKLDHVELVVIDGGKA